MFGVGNREFSKCRHRIAPRPTFLLHSPLKINHSRRARNSYAINLVFPISLPQNPRIPPLSPSRPVRPRTRKVSKVSDRAPYTIPYALLLTYCCFYQIWIMVHVPTQTHRRHRPTHTQDTSNPTGTARAVVAKGPRNGHFCVGILGLTGQRTRTNGKWVIQAKLPHT